METPPIDHRVDRTLVAKAAQEILTFLREKNVRDTSDLFTHRQHLGERKHGIEVCFAPSHGATHTHTLCYGAFPRGVPVMVKINPTLDYTTLTIKGTFPKPEGYTPWMPDCFGNTIYDRRLQGTEIPLLLSELERLANTGESTQS